VTLASFKAAMHFKDGGRRATRVNRRVGPEFRVG